MKSTIKDRLLAGTERPTRLANQIVDFVTHRAQVRSFLAAFYAESGGWDPPGSVRPAEYPFLEDICREASKDPGPIVEIGTLFGFTTNKIALWKRADQELITVDNYSWNPCGLPREAHFHLAQRVLEFAIATARVEQVRKEKSEFFDEYSAAAPAMVFLDADHTYEETKKDIEWARRVGAKIVAGHDYSDECPGVMRAVDGFGGPSQRVVSLWRL